MAVFPVKKYYSFTRSRLFKRLIFFKILLFCLLSLNAQIESNVKLKIETGILWTSKSANSGFPYFNGLFLHLEPKLKTSKNTFIGLRIGILINEKIENFEPIQSLQYDNPSTGIIDFINPDNRLISFVPTFDYFFNKRKYRPYLGVGMGYHFLTNYNKVSQSGMGSPSEVLEVNVNNQIGILLRGGLSLWKLIIGLEFNFIPRADIEMPNGQKIGTVSNSYVGLSIGYEIGVGKSSK